MQHIVGDALSTPEANKRADQLLLYSHLNERYRARQLQPQARKHLEDDVFAEETANLFTFGESGGNTWLHTMRRETRRSTRS